MTNLEVISVGYFGFHFIRNIQNRLQIPYDERFWQNGSIQTPNILVIPSMGMGEDKHKNITHTIKIFSRFLGGKCDKI